MPYQANLSPEHGCVVLALAGRAPFGEVLAGRWEANRLLMTNHCRRLVVDVTRLRTIPLAAELFNLGRSISLDAPVIAGVRIALLIRPDQSRHAKLFQSVARIAGASVWCFFTCEQALTWFASASAADARHL